MMVLLKKKKAGQGLEINIHSRKQHMYMLTHE